MTPQLKLSFRGRLDLACPHMVTSPSNWELAINKQVKLMKKEITNRHRREASVLSIAWTTPDVIALSKKRVYSQSPTRLYFMVLAMQIKGKKFRVPLTGTVEDFQWNPCGYYHCTVKWKDVIQQVLWHPCWYIHSGGRKRTIWITVSPEATRIMALLLLYISTCVCAHALVIPSQMLLQYGDWTWVWVAGATLVLKSQFATAIGCWGFFIPFSFSFSALLFFFLLIWAPTQPDL